MSVPPVRRGELIGKQWWFEGDDVVNEGMFMIRKITGNTYTCTRLTGTGVNMDDFDIGYVIHETRVENEKNRES